jgi:hypothetical protein
VLSIAGWLYDNFEIVSFIDTCVCGYSGELLKIIDKEYCYDDDTGFYDYNMRNLSTSHVYMMLSVALSKMIYNTGACSSIAKRRHGCSRVRTRSGFLLRPSYYIPTFLVA